MFECRVVLNTRRHFKAFCAVLTDIPETEQVVLYVYPKTNTTHE